MSIPLTRNLSVKTKKTSSLFTSNKEVVHNLVKRPLHIQYYIGLFVDLARLSISLAKGRAAGGTNYICGIHILVITDSITAAGAHIATHALVDSLHILERIAAVAHAAIAVAVVEVIEVHSLFFS